MSDTSFVIFWGPPAGVCGEWCGDDSERPLRLQPRLGTVRDEGTAPRPRDGPSSREESTPGDDSVCHVLQPSILCDLEVLAKLSTFSEKSGIEEHKIQ